MCVVLIFIYSDCGERHRKTSFAQNTSGIYPLSGFIVCERLRITKISGNINLRIIQETFSVISLKFPLQVRSVNTE